MIYNSVAEIYHSLDKTRDKFNQTIKTLSAQTLDLREDNDGWSISEIIEHLVIVESGIIKIIEKLLEKAENHGKKFNGVFDPPLSLEKIIEAGKDKKFNAPEFTYPQNSITFEESLSFLAKNRVELKKLQQRIEEIDSSDQKFPHPVFGKINVYEWLAVINFHEFRHLLQIERILKTK